MNTQLSLKNQFLIAMPNMGDPNFYHSVTYICEHNQDGAMGIIINHPMEISLIELLTHMDIKTDDIALHHIPVLSGGPVQQERGFVIHRPKGNWQSTLQVTEHVSITTSKDILLAIANHQGPQNHLITLGYAGWDPGQLEEEMAKNTWLSGPSDPSIIFETPFENRWKAAANLMGIDIERISGDIGHA